MKSTEVGQEGGTNQAKMVKIGAANGCSPPVDRSNLNTTHNTGMRIRVWSPVQVVPDVTGTNQSAEHAVGDVDQNTRENSVAVGATGKREQNT